MNESTPTPDPKNPHDDGLAELGGLNPRDLFVDGLRTPAETGKWEPPSAEHVARLLPQFRVEALIGHGGMGAVYRAAQPRLDRLVAIKLLPAELAANEEFVARFEREARTLAKLHHPSIVGIHDFGQTSEGHLYFVMEFVNGTDLARIISTGTLEAMQALSLTIQVCEALQYAHSQQVIHRDIKPANVLVTLDGHAKLADFGLARPLNETEIAALTASNLVMGTPDYMAPEQRAGLGDHRVDIYALGVMLYEMLTGRRPHGIFDPPSMKVQVDVRLDEVVIKAMREEPERRYQQASEMRLDVDRIRSTPQPKLVKKPDIKSDAKPAAPKAPPRPVKVRRARPGMRSWIIPMAGAALLTLAAIVAVQSGWLQPSSGAKARPPLEPPSAPESPPSASTATSPALSAGMLTFKGHRYQFVHGVFTWTEAKEKAVSMGGHLATITSAEENTWVQQEMALQNIRCLWLGGFKESGRWQWVTGEPWQFTDWGNGNPSGDPEDKLEILGDYWNDVRNEPLARPKENNGLLVEWDDSTAGKFLRDAPAAPSKTEIAVASKESPYENTLGMKFVPVPIISGLTNGQRVLFSVWDTRVQDYEFFARDTGRGMPKADFAQGPTHPMVNISWDDAQVFSQWLTTHEQAAGRLSAEWRYRLPTDHEWSCAAEIGTREDASKLPCEKGSSLEDVFPWGTQWPPPAGAGNYAGEELRPTVASGKYNLKDVIAGYNDGFVNTSPVGSFPANRLGLYDMGGNVWQWVEDWNSRDHVHRVLRGGCWNNSDRRGLLSSTRSISVPYSGINFRGFRCVLAPAGSSTGAVSTNASGGPSLAGWVSLMDRIDPSADALKGRWNRVADGLQGVTLGDENSPRGLLQLPYEPPQEYDFRITFTTQDGSGEASQLLSAFGHQFQWSVASGQHGEQDRWTGFDRVNGKGMKDSAAAVKVAGQLSRNQRYESLVQVRRDRVTGYIDGKKIVDWPTDYHEMTEGAESLRDRQAIGINIWWSKTTFHDISVREVTGKGKFLREAAPASSQPQVVSTTREKPFVNTLGMKFVRVPGTAIFMCIHETRKSDYYQYWVEHPGLDSSWRNPGSDGGPVSFTQDHPVVNVDWNNAKAFCEWLGKKEGLTYRLPTDHEWSLAVGIGDREDTNVSPMNLSNQIRGEYPWGKDWPPPRDFANLADSAMAAKFPTRRVIPSYSDGFATTAPVMSFKPNALGIYDLCGNVWQWTSDWSNNSHSDVVLRGSCWDSWESQDVLSSHRISAKPDFRHIAFGFRCVFVPGFSTASAATTVPQPPSTGEWRDLFDGNSFKGWDPSTTTGWRVDTDDRALVSYKSGMLVAEPKLLNYELELEWLVKPGGNGGLFYGVQERAFNQAPEFQLCDPNAAMGTSRSGSPKDQSGSLCSVLAPTRDATNPVGQWNTARLVVNGTQRQHWINGVQVLLYDLASPSYQEALSASMHKNKAPYTTAAAGAVALQCNWGEVTYRNIRVRELPAQPEPSRGTASTPGSTTQGAAGAPVPLDTQTWDLVADLDFEKSQEQFPVGAEEHMKGAWKDGRYELTANAAGTWWPGEPKLQKLALRDFVCEAEAEIPRQGEGSWGIGMIGGHPWIGVKTDANGRSEIYSYDEKPLVTWMDTPAMKAGRGWNKVRVEAVGPRIRLFINDHFVVETKQEGRLMPAALTLFVETHAPPFEAWFRRMRVWQPKNNATANTVPSTSSTSVLLSSGSGKTPVPAPETSAFPSKPREQSGPVRFALPAVPPVQSSPSPSLNAEDFGGWKFTGDPQTLVKEGNLILISSGPRSGIVSGRDDFKSFTLRMELAGTADVVAWAGLRVNQGLHDWKGYTNAIRGHDGVVSTRHASADFIPTDGDENPAAASVSTVGMDVPAGTFFNLELTVRSDGSLWTKMNGRTISSGFMHVGPTGQIGLFVSQGALKVRKIEIENHPR